MPLNIRDLEYFLAIAELKHFGKAAKKCHVSQPTLSGQIKKLEEQLGISLFERSNKKVMLTEAGEDIIPFAQSVLFNAEQICETSQTFKNPLAGRLRLGAIPTLASYLFPDFVTQVRDQLPELTLILTEEKTDTLIEQLNKGLIDAAIVALPISHDLFASEVLFEDEFLLAVPTSHTFYAYSSITMEQLKNQQLLLLEEGHCLRGQALEACAAVSIHEHNFMATSLETLRQMVKAGTGITIMPKIATLENEKDITYIPFTSSSQSRTIGLIWRKTHLKKTVIEKTINILKSSRSHQK